MPKVRTTLTIDEEVLRAVRVRAARTGVGDSQVVEAALRRDLGLDRLERLWGCCRIPLMSELRGNVTSPRAALGSRVPAHG
jgi:hypothetical protein